MSLNSLQNGKQGGALHYFHKNNALINAGTSTSVAAGRFTKARVGAHHGVKRLRDLAGVFPFLVKLLFTPKNSILLFNHTGRVRKNGEGTASLYAGRLAEEIPGLIIIDEGPTQVRYARGSLAFNSAWVASAAGVLRRLDRKNEPALAVFFVKKFIWKNVFRWLKVKKIFLVVWYGKEWAVAAAKDLGIPVIELQHGIVYEQHPFYNIAEDRKVQESDYLLPDFEYVYGEYWAEKHRKMGWEPGRLKVGGFFLDISKKNSAALPLSPYILYSSQPGFDYAIKAHIRSVKEELEARNVLAVIAPHPAESIHSFDDIIGSHVKIFPGIDSYDLLSECRAHVSLFSTLLIEAILFKKPSYQIDLRSERSFIWNIDDLVEMGINRKIKLGEFPEFDTSGPAPVDSVKVKYFFEDFSVSYFLSL